MPVRWRHPWRSKGKVAKLGKRLAEAVRVVLASDTSGEGLCASGVKSRFVQWHAAQEAARREELREEAEANDRGSRSFKPADARTAALTARAVPVD